MSECLARRGSEIEGMKTDMLKLSIKARDKQLYTESDRVLNRWDAIK